MNLRSLLSIAVVLSLSTTLCDAASLKTESCGDGCTAWTVAQPITAGDGRGVEVPEVVLQTGDTIYITAGGCVSVPELGRRRVQFAERRDANSSQFAGGFIFVPGVTSGLTPLTRVTGVNWRVSSAVEQLTSPTPYLAFFKGGAGGQGPSACAAKSGEHYVTLRVTRSSAPPTHEKPFDLVVDHYDSNGFAFNPHFAGQKTQNTGSLGELDPSLCEYFKLHGGLVDTAVCTRQRPYFDRYARRGLRPCPLNLLNRLHGHVNWAPVTVTGTLTFKELSDDGDWNFDLVPDNGGLLTTQNHGAIHLEMAAYEVRGLRTTLWRAFEEKVRTRDFAGARDLLTGSNGTKAVVIGILGLDSEHNSYAEIHPIYGLAVQKPGEPNTWQVLVRNFGNEGDCSRFNHLLLTDTVTVDVAGNGVPEVMSERKAPEITVEAHSGGASLAYRLPAPEQSAMVDDVVALRWNENAAPTSERRAVHPRLTYLLRDTALERGQRALLCSGPAGMRLEICQAKPRSKHQRVKQ